MGEALDPVILESVTSLQTAIIDAGTIVTLNCLRTGVADHAPPRALTCSAPVGTSRR